MTLAQAIGKRVANLLAERNLNQYYLYKNGGIPKSTVSETISAKKKHVSTGTVWQICETLGISLADFFNDSLFDDITD